MASSVAGIITNDKDGEARKSLDNERENHKVFHERVERIAPPRLPNPVSVEQAGKAGESGEQMYHNGKRRDGYRVGGGYDRGGWAQQPS